MYGFIEHHIKSTDWAVTCSGSQIPIGKVLFQL